MTAKKKVDPSAEEIELPSSRIAAARITSANVVKSST